MPGCIVKKGNHNRDMLGYIVYNSVVKRKQAIIGPKSLTSLGNCKKKD
ncbi:hypothetical protein Pint_29564 [Pistacia integerrima]|uniref:Uncharacterized protein n=1 Tax=Pistacia integerrima TaxID=434235 RepID=A0ACC0WZ86_9ROSI|nr:hypothetical protein Pint_29564 [Pistacia integerrima]